MEQAVRQEFEDRFPIPEGIEWRPSDYFPIHTENVHEYICRCGRASRYADMWQAWQASRAALRVELPEPYAFHQEVQTVFLDRVKEALQQAGIEVK
ncbi:TPA: hypothetical protein ACGJPT_005413 [Pseudomonas aeruginosa]|uniref:hypothetical protein n=1 Tax=Pseudomonas aeruginosa TaxID=287 RepID=UPI00053DC60F|nr:hypothetical protein [Pseudomonas aeruginosa]